MIPVSGYNKRALVTSAAKSVRTRKSPGLGTSGYLGPFRVVEHAGPNKDQPSMLPHGFFELENVVKIIPEIVFGCPW